jgi:hypothetical protein
MADIAAAARLFRLLLTLAGVSKYGHAPMTFDAELSAGGVIGIRVGDLCGCHHNGGEDVLVAGEPNGLPCSRIWYILKPSAGFGVD